MCYKKHKFEFIFQSYLFAVVRLHLRCAGHVAQMVHEKCIHNFDLKTWREEITQKTEALMER